MTNLYDVLEVEKTADKAEIRRAYRNKAKAAHPDNQETGNAKTFALVKLAHDVLTDEQRRAQYDQTGEYGEKNPDSTFSDVVNMISNALDEVLSDIAKQSGIEYITAHNLIPRMKASIVKYKESVQENLENLHRIQKVFKSLETRFKRRFKSEQPNVMEAMIAARLAGCREQIQTKENHRKHADEALAMLSEYEFEIDSANKPPHPAMMSTLDMMLRGNMGGR